MGFLNKDSLPHLVEKLSDSANIKISGNSYGNRVSTVVNKIVTKADEVTRALEQEVVNNAHSFKVGTGNVDVSSDVQDGFGEVGIKGVTYHNLFNDFSIANDIKNYISTNGDRIKWNKSEVTTHNVNIKYHNSLVQLSKTYTLVFYIYKNTLQMEGAGDSYDVAKFNIASYDKGFYCIPVNKTGLVKVKLIQPTTTRSDGKPYLEVYKESLGELEISYPILLEGDCTNDDKIPSQFEGIVGVGDKSKNLFNVEVYKNVGLNSDNGYTNATDRRDTTDYFEVEPNTSYVISNCLVQGRAYYDANKKYVGSFDKGSDSYVTFKTPSNVKYVRFSVDGSISYDIQIEKGTAPTPFKPHYDGHKIEILSSGKNIFDKSTITDNSYIDANGDVISYNGWFSSDFIRVHKGEKYYIYNEKHREPFAGLYSYYYDVNKNKIEHLNLGDVELVGIKEFVSKYDGYIRISGITRHIEKGKFYVNSDKTQILLDEPLMRLPNGICDEITRDGKLIRRVGKTVIDENVKRLGHNGTSSNHNQFVVHGAVTTPNSINHANLLCDKKPCKVDNSGSNSVWVYSKTTLVFQMDSTINSVEKMRQWLSQNPTTVYYELEAPVITELPAPYLRIFKDGHLRFNTLVAPESTHVVQLNKSGQIERSVREVQSLDSRVKKLESFYDEMILETSHKLNLLTYDFEYTKESEDI